MLGNIIDGRTDKSSPEVDAVFEPSAHDNAKRENGSYVFDLDEAMDDPGYFHVTQSYDTTIRDAVLRAETEWRFAVTLYLYDRGSRPLG